MSEAIPREFHIYPNEETVEVVMDKYDPQRAEIMQAMAGIFNEHGRTREADECLGIGING